MMKTPINNPMIMAIPIHPSVVFHHPSIANKLVYASIGCCLTWLRNKLGSEGSTGESGLLGLDGEPSVPSDPEGFMGFEGAEGADDGDVMVVVDKYVLQLFCNEL
jgi:hypothetical protein